MPEQASYHQHLKEKTTQLWDLYQLLVAEFFSGATDLETFLELFNHHFHSYQESKKLKLDPLSLRQGQISCSVAALFTGIWKFQHDGQKAFYFLEKGSSHNSESKVGMHTAVVLASHSNEALNSYHAVVNGQQHKNVVDYTIGRGLKPASQRSVALNYSLISGSREYLFNRVRTFGIRTNQIEQAKQVLSIRPKVYAKSGN